MKDDFQVPNIGQAPQQYDPNFFSRFIRNIEMTLMTMRSVGKVTSSIVALSPTTVAGLPDRSRVGWVAYVTDGRKNGEGAGAGTGVLVFYDGTNWIACDSGQTVSV